MSEPSPSRQFIKRYFLPILGAIVSVVGYGSRFFQFGTSVIDWMSRLEFVRDHFPAVITFLRSAISPQGGNVVTLVGLILFFLSFFVIQYRREAQGFAYSPAAVSASGSDASPRTKVVELAPNIISLRAEQYAAERRDGMIVESDLSGVIDLFFATAIPFCNRMPESGHEIGVADNVTARIMYRSIDADQILEVNRVPWLAHVKKSVFFGLNDTHHLVAVTLEEASGKKWEAYAIKRDPTGRRGSETRPAKLLGNLIRASVVLLDEERGKTIHKADFILEISRQNCAVDVTLANEWHRKHLLEFARKGVEMNATGKLDEINEWIKESRSFVGLHVGEYEGQRLGLTHEEYGNQNASLKALNPWNPRTRISKNVEILLELSERYSELKRSRR